jgi:hypothetical protein
MSAFRGKAGTEELTANVRIQELKTWYGSQHNVETRELRYRDDLRAS